VALLLPLLFFLLLIPWVRRFQTRRSLAQGGWEGTLLIASAAVGTFHTLTLEAVSRIEAIRPSILAATWLMGSIALAVPLVRPVFLGRRPRNDSAS